VTYDWIVFRGAGEITAFRLFNTIYPVGLWFEFLNLRDHTAHYFNVYAYNDWYLLLILLLTLCKQFLSKSRKMQPLNLRQLSTLK